MIAIKGMKEMPTDCYSCFLSASDCLVSIFKHDRRADGCPLAEIITCGDCKHRIGCKCESLNLITDDDGYCSNGERRR